MSSRFCRGALGAAAVLLMASPALPQAALEVAEARPNSTEGVVRGPHGCEGAAPRAVPVGETEVPAEGQDARALKHPAPTMRIVLAQAGGAQAGAAPATAFRAGPLVIEAHWSRATPGRAQVAGGYMRITNTGSEPDRLVGGTAAVAGRFEVHEMSMTEGVMRMRPVEGGLVIRPGETVELKPGGYHAMLMDLRQPLKEGDTVKGTLVFEKAGPMAIEYRVGGLGAQAPGGHAH